MERMFGEWLEIIDEEVIDMVGEIINMVIGGVKNLFGEKGYEFDMVMLVVVFGKGYIIVYKCEGVKVLILFMLVDGNVNIEVSFDKLWVGSKK